MQKKERMANLEVLRCGGNDDGGRVALSGQGRIAAGSDGSAVRTGYRGMAAGSILHRGGQCLHDDQRLLLCESSFKLSRLLTLCGYSCGCILWESVCWRR